MRSNLIIVLAVLAVFCLVLLTQHSVLAQSKVRVEKTGVSKLERYMIIAKNNLFTSLGTGDEVKRQEFALAGIMGKVALIQIVGQPRTYYVAGGEQFANGATLARIGEDTVTVVHEGRKMELKLGIGVSGGRSGQNAKQSRPDKRTKSPRSAEAKRMSKGGGKSEKKQAKKEYQENVKKKMDNLSRERDEVKKKIEAMESKGLVDSDAYRKLAEIDSDVQKLKPSLR